MRKSPIPHPSYEERRFPTLPLLIWISKIHLGIDCKAPPSCPLGISKQLFCPVCCLQPLPRSLTPCPGDVPLPGEEISPRFHIFTTIPALLVEVLGLFVSNLSIKAIFFHAEIDCTTPRMKEKLF